LPGNPLRVASCNGSNMQWVQRLATAGYPLLFQCNGCNVTNRHESCGLNPVTRQPLVANRHTRESSKVSPYAEGEISRLTLDV
jgi:hypothetical protein